MVIARNRSVRTGRIVVPAVRTVLALLRLANTARHKSLNSVSGFPEMNTPDLGNKGGNSRVGKIHTARIILRAVT